VARVEVDGGRHREALRHDLHFSRVHVQPDDLPLEQERAVQLIVRAKLETIEKAGRGEDLASRLVPLRIDFPQRIGPAELGDVEPAVAAEGKRVDARQIRGDGARLAIRRAPHQPAGEIAGPVDGAIGPQGHVIRAAEWRPHQGGDRARAQVDGMDRLAEQIAGQQVSIAIDDQPMHALEGRAGHHHLLAMDLGRSGLGLRVGIDL
jgi:hypothetical protein